MWRSTGSSKRVRQEENKNDQHYNLHENEKKQCTQATESSSSSSSIITSTVLSLPHPLISYMIMFRFLDLDELGVIAACCKGFYEILQMKQFVQMYHDDASLGLKRTRFLQLLSRSPLRHLVQSSHMNVISDYDIELLHLLQHFTNLQRLSIQIHYSHHPFTFDVQIFRVLNSSLRELEIRCDSGDPLCSTAISQLTKLKKLKISLLYIDEAYVNSSLLKDMVGLEYLDFQVVSSELLCEVVCDELPLLRELHAPYVFSCERALPSLQKLCTQPVAPPLLNTLTLGEVPAEDHTECAELLSQLPSLTSIHYLVNQGALPFTFSRWLTHLTLFERDISDDGVAALTVDNFPNLIYLNFDSVIISTRRLCLIIASFKKLLQELVINISNKEYHVDFATLSQCTQLTKLELAHCDGLSPVELFYMRACTQLHTLSIHGVDWSSFKFQILKVIPSLRNLTFD